MTKDCGNHERDKRIRAVCGCLGLLIIIVLLIVLIVYLVLRPTKPKFYLQDATVLQFNLSNPPNLLTSQIQVTISSRNPNDNIGIFYDRLDIYASYQSQQITLANRIPPLYQGHKDVDVWSPYLYGEGIPIAPYLGEALIADEADGFFFLFIKIDGRIRWKVGTWTSDHYHLFVNCPAYLSFEKSSSSLGAGESKTAMPVIRFQQISTCSVDI